MENQEIKETTSISENPVWQKGYTSAIEDLRVGLATIYNRDRKFSIRDVIMYLYRDINFKDLYHWKYLNIWTDENY